MTRPVTILFHKNDNRQLKRIRKKNKQKQKNRQREREKQRILWHFLTRGHKSWPLHKSEFASQTFENQTLSS